VRRTANPFSGYRSPQRVSHPLSNARQRMLANVPSMATKAPQRSDFYADLSLFGKAVAGCVEILTSVTFDYCMGYASGYFIGTVLGVPRVMFFGEKASSTGDMWRNLIDRTKQIHSKSNSYGRSWGNVSAVFGGSRTAVNVVRGNAKNDDWNEIFSSVLAGALMSRSGAYVIDSRRFLFCSFLSVACASRFCVFLPGGPQAMLRSAVIYGGIMYLLSSGSKRMTPFASYEEQLVEF
jgi:Tim17/Tim22/Tim23/Pmp24 family